MFGDEGGNKAKLRAEQAKKDRLKMLEKQASKASSTVSSSVPPSSAPVPSSSALASAGAAGLPNAPLPSPASFFSPPPAFPPQVASTKEEALLIASRERELRAKHRKFVQSCVKVQAYARRLLARRATMARVRSDFDAKIATLVKFVEVVTSSKSAGGKKASCYIPPQATASSLTTSVLFLLGRSPSRPSSPKSKSLLLSDLSRLSSLFSHVLHAGLRSSDPSIHPFGAGGSQALSLRSSSRVKRLLALAVEGLGRASEEDLTPKSKASFRVFLEDVTTRIDCEQKGNETFASFCEEELVSERKVDIIMALRNHLLSPKCFGAVPPPTIPSNDARTSSSSMFFSLVMTMLKNSFATGSASFSYFASRFTLEVLSVPLLPYRLSNEDLDTLSFEMHRLSKSTMNLVVTYGRPQLAALLPVYSITEISVPATLALFCNLVSLIVRTPTSPSASPQLPVSTHTIELLTLLLEEIPLASLGSSAAVSWVKSSSSTHTPVVIPAHVADEGKRCISDVFARRLLSSLSVGGEYYDLLYGDASSPDVLALEGTMTTMTSSDLELADSAKAATSSSEVASRDARTDVKSRKKSWFSSPSSWANKIENFFGKGGKSPASTSALGGGAGGLIDTSSEARRVAVSGVAKARAAEAGENACKADAKRASVVDYEVVASSGVAALLATLLSRWGGRGGFNVVRREALVPGEATTAPEGSVISLVNILCYTSRLTRALWAYIISDQKRIDQLLDSKDVVMTSASSRSHRGLLASISLFASLLSNALAITEDSEIHELGRPLPVHHLRRVIILFKNIVHKACRRDLRAGSPPSDSAFGVSLVSTCASVLRDLYDRSSRRPLCSSELWLVSDHEVIAREMSQASSSEQCNDWLESPIMHVLPFGVSLKSRLRLFETVVKLSREGIQGSNDRGTLRAGIALRVKRGRELEDGLAGMNKLGARLRERLCIQYVNEFGVAESGIDVGGLFKEFWCDLCALSFSPNYALFCSTEGGVSHSGGALYPNHLSGAAHGSDHVVLFEFLGRILWKALYEGITIQPVFAHFFLSFIKGDYNYMHMLPDLSTLDGELYKNLIFLKGYEGDASDLALTFSVTDDSFGAGKEVPLIPNGSKVDVNNSNKLRYIHLVAKYHMSDKIKVQSEAFSRGLHEVIDKSWLKVFNEPELQVLISGASGGRIDVEDMKKNCRYAGGYTSFDRNVARFWNVVEGLTVEEQALLLKFTTSCERPPPLGFASLHPPFTITRVGIDKDSDKLPSASTCFNNFKLPTYSSEKVMREKILMSIKSGAGFEMS